MRFKVLRKADTKSWEHLKAETYDYIVNWYNMCSVSFSDNSTVNILKSANEDTESSRSLRIFKSTIGLRNHSLRNTSHTMSISIHIHCLQEIFISKLKHLRQESSILRKSFNRSQNQALTYLKSLRPGCETHCSGRPKRRAGIEKKSQKMADVRNYQ